MGLVGPDHTDPVRFSPVCWLYYNSTDKEADQMILSLVLINLIVCSLAFNEAMIYEGRKWNSFKWDEHLFFNAQRAIIAIALFSSNCITVKQLIGCSVSALLMFMFFHNGIFYQARKWIDIANGVKPDYPRGFFDMTKTPYRLAGRLQLSFPFWVRAVFFVAGMTVFLVFYFRMF